MDRAVFDNVSKRYVLGERMNARETINAVVKRVVRRDRPEAKELWSLRDVSFSVAEGEALGIVGRNGAGKSTILKILSNITPPTAGLSRTRGRVAALLEVGTGFHPALTGRDNVYLNGAILGMSRRDITARFDQIVDFSGVERFLDTPVKRYSSGMYLRLAFAVAAHLEPDVLVVDEILAVGDAEFQRKCLGRMHEAEAEGRTLVFVSHNLESLSRLCSRSLWLDAGRVQDVGPTTDIVRSYLSSGLSGEDGNNLFPVEAGPVALQAVRVVSVDGVDSRRRPLMVGETFSIEVDLEVRHEVSGLDVGILVTTSSGLLMLDENLRQGWQDTMSLGRHRVAVEVPAVLNADDYTVGIWLGTRHDTFLFHPVGAAGFSVHGLDTDRPGRLLALGLSFRVEPMD
jgi:ABC-2 type transport system ATP-binding protein/lipopolysaccharide transport system ATP-binding protein